MNKFLEKISENYKLNLSKFYPLFFTLIFIIVVLQYSCSSFEAILYDLRVRWDIGIGPNKDFVIISLDEESNQFLGENFPYSYATHSRFIEKLIEEKPKAVGYFVGLEDPYYSNEKDSQKQFRHNLERYIADGGIFRFGTEMDGWGEQIPPVALRELGYSLAQLNRDGSIFARDDVSRRALVNTSGDETFHLWMANSILEKGNKPGLEGKKIFGSYYQTEAEATFALYRFFDSTVKGDSEIDMIPFHKVVVGNFPLGFFKDKIVLVGPNYISNSSDSIRTPFNEEESRSSKLNVHAQIINAFMNKKTVYSLPRTLSDILAILVGLFLSLAISRLQPAKGLMVTFGTLGLILFTSFALFSFFGLWLYTTHLIISVFIVYYIWVPFRAIDEYQTRYKIEEESKLLKKVDNLKQNFISLMSHDLKTPVAKIAGIADILRHQFDNSPEQRTHLTRITDSTKELNKFITSILDLTKIESQNLQLKLVSKDINQVIEEVLESLAYEIKEKEIIVSKNLSPLFPIGLDIILIKRVISNLVENAIKYSSKGSQVDVKTYDDDNWVYIEVKDTGPGIPEKDLEHIFEKFYRVKNDANHSIKGSGLGLYLVKYFIELHQGSILVDSVVGEGTKFTVMLRNS